MATMLIQLTPDLLTNKLTCLVSSETTNIPEQSFREILYVMSIRSHIGDHVFLTSDPV